MCPISGLLTLNFGPLTSCLSPSSLTSDLRVLWLRTWSGSCFGTLSNAIQDVFGANVCLRISFPSVSTQRRRFWVYLQLHFPLGRRRVSAGNIRWRLKLLLMYLCRGTSALRLWQTRRRKRRRGGGRRNIFLWFYCCSVIWSRKIHSHVRSY